MKLSFTSPDGWQMPEDATPGQPFQAVGTFLADEDGNITLTAIDGTEIAMDDGEIEDEEMEVEMTIPEKEVSNEEEMMGRAKKMGIFA
jgi:DNA polymerase III sliding clamp (beta) subunit (PCNA family)